MKRTHAVVGALTALTALLAGCSKGGDQGKVVSDANKEQQEIARIKADPNLPPQAKAAAIKNMEIQKKAALQAQAGRPSGS